MTFSTLNLEKTPSMRFSKNLVKIKYIQHIQSDLISCNAKRIDLKIDFLNQSYVFQLIAFWQVFIEDLAGYGFKKIEKSENGKVFKSIAKARLDEALKKFNTPNVENINKLFKDTLGVEYTTTHWKSKNLTNQQAALTLAELLKARHQIAHTGRSTNKLSYKNNFEKMEILMEMAVLTEKAIINELESALGTNQ